MYPNKFLQFDEHRICIMNTLFDLPRESNFRFTIVPDPLILDSYHVNINTIFNTDVQCSFEQVKCLPVCIGVHRFMSASTLRQLLS